MTSALATADPVVELDHFLAAQAADCARIKSADFDMNDGPERSALVPFPKLLEVVDWLDAKVTQPWARADAAAIRHQRRHSKLARTAIATGIGAIILAVLQLALKLGAPHLTHAAFWLELVTVLGGVVSVGVGLWAKTDRSWLGQRHLAERLRLLKFRALARPECWNGKSGEWKSWLEKQLNLLHDAEEFIRVEEWSRGDSTEPNQPVPVDTLETTCVDSSILATYYRHKRLTSQSNYFRHSGAAAERLAKWQRRLRLPLFFVTIGCVLVHFVADWVAGCMASAAHDGAARSWELVALWGVAMAVVLPVCGVGIRAWTAALEAARKARSFGAKHAALEHAIRRLEHDRHHWPTVLGHLQHDESFLEQEHREWLRLLLEAEWFI